MKSGWDCVHSPSPKSEHRWNCFPPPSPDFRVSLLIWSIVETQRWRGCTSSHLLDSEEKLPELLLNIGATPHLADSRGRTPLHACIFASLRVSEYVSQCDEEWDAETAEIFSQSTSSRERLFPYNVIAELLLRNGSLDAQDDDGHTPLDYALVEMDRAEHEDERRELMSWSAWRVARFTLRLAYQCGMCPSDAVKTRLTERLGQDVLHPEDPLAVKGASAWDCDGHSESVGGWEG